MHIQCSYQRWLDQYVDGELPEGLRQEVDAHLLECQACAEEVRKLRQVTQALKALSVPLQPTRLKERVMARVMAEETGQRVNGAMGQWVKGVMGQRVKESARFWRWGLRRLWYAVLGALGVTAAVLCAVLLLSPSPVGAVTLTLKALRCQQSAHFTGWAYWCREPERGQGTSQFMHMKLEGWYQAPDRFRYDSVEEGRRQTTCVQVGSQLLMIYSSGQPILRGKEVRKRATFLTFFDLFTQEGLLSRALLQGGRLVRQWEEAMPNGKVARVFAVQVERPEFHEDWVLYTDQVTHLVVAARQEVRRRRGNKLLSIAVVERIDYNVPVPANIFE